MLIAGSIFAMICVSINLRAFATMKNEVEENSRLSGQIQNLMDENLAIQEEIHMLKTNPAVIEREARKIGVGLKQEKVSGAGKLN
jgi:cell division protein FtsB